MTESEWLPDNLSALVLFRVREIPRIIARPYEFSERYGPYKTDYSWTESRLCGTLSAKLLRQT
jgi:hypothetical protein